MTTRPTYPNVLTKENFWNALTEKYPDQMKVFLDWIDEYKKKINWDKLFANVCFIENNNGPDMVVPPKFHEIPIAMQIGIIMEFSMNQEPDADALKNDFINGIEEIIKRVNI